MLVLKDSMPGKPLLLHEEPIYLNDKIIAVLIAQCNDGKNVEWSLFL